MEYYSAMKRNKLRSYIETWMNLESVIESAVKPKREKHHILMLICAV